MKQTWYYQPVSDHPGFAEVQLEQYEADFIRDVQRMLRDDPYMAHDFYYQMNEWSPLRIPFAAIPRMTETQPPIRGRLVPLSRTFQPVYGCDPVPCEVGA